jgi:hypothetical protein
MGKGAKTAPVEVCPSCPSFSLFQIFKSEGKEEEELNAWHAFAIFLSFIAPLREILDCFFINLRSAFESTFAKLPYI